MKKSITFLAAAIIFAAIASPAEARKKNSYQVDPGCNVIMPCPDVDFSPRAKRLVGIPFGAPVQTYTPKSSAQIMPHPAGCPRRLFCGCGAAVEVFGSPVRSLWLAAEWGRRFPATAPAAGMVGVRHGGHHVFVLRQHMGGHNWLVYDANSGRGLTRVHVRSIAGYKIVNPRA